MDSFNNQKTNLTAIDFFCGAGGMTNGLRQAGINVLAGIDIDSSCKETYETNNPGSQFIQADIKKLEPVNLSVDFDITFNPDKTIFVGCSPCQYWTNINTIRNKSKHSKSLLKEFTRFLDYYKPAFIIIENVPGIINNPEESGLSIFKEFLTNHSYKFIDGKINAHHYGVPQNRIRYLLIASRVTDVIGFPEKLSNNQRLNVRDVLGNNLFPNIPAGHTDPTAKMHTTAALTDINLRRLSLTPKNGGNRLSWKNITDLQIPAYKNKDNLFIDVYGRMFWDKPSPTITTKFLSLSNGRFGHPEQDRAISIREGAALQTFPNDYKFISSSRGIIARLIGNAVPPQLSRRIGETIYHYFTDSFTDKS